MKKELLESLILKGINTHESSNLPRSFSPSMLGSTLLQNFLTKVFGYQPDDSIGHNTLGSLMHYSLQHLVASDNILNEMKYKYEMKNGVTLSFIVDMITLDKDGFVTSIHDYKLTKIYAGKQLKKEKNHPYALQLNAYYYALKELGLISPNFEGLFIDMFYKDADVLLKEEIYEQIPIPLIAGIEDIIISKSDELFSYIDEGEMPPECTNEDKWIRKMKSGVVVPSRCVAYCSLKTVCPYFKGESLASNLSSW